jgi:NAD-dependent dihydropyrimidine dehydrogenase PreA subunit
MVNGHARLGKGKELWVERTVYHRLARHLSTLGMGYPPGEELEDILRENFTPLEATVALSLPTKVRPLKPASVDEIAQTIDLPQPELSQILERLAARGLLFSGRTRNGQKGYALQQMGYGFPQAFFWKGEKNPQSRKMAHLIKTYTKTRNVNFEVYATTKTKNYRYIPAKQSMDQDIHAVLPFDQIETVIQEARRIAVAHCSCRVSADILGRGCDHPMEVCMKYDDLADYVIEMGLAREISKAEALEIIHKSEEAGLVHMVDNARAQIKHTCNCCGCSCWSVGTIKRRRIPRDELIATYFIRETDREACTGCGQCVDICPVDAIAIAGDYPTVDQEWCIGCGLCLTPCPTSAAILRRKTSHIPAKDFRALHTRILGERGKY